MRFPCLHLSLERQIARLAQRMVSDLQASPGAIRIRWNAATARFIATLEAEGQIRQATSWAEGEVKTYDQTSEQVVRTRLARLLRGAATGGSGWGGR